MSTPSLACLHAAAAAAYLNGCRAPENILPAPDLAALRSSGISAQTLYDYVEDFTRHGWPTREDFVAVAGIRREVFLHRLGSRWPSAVIPEHALPRKEDAMDGIPWLPRIIAKARGFLEGSLCPEIMYGCSGDHRFLNSHRLTLPGFLATVRDAQEDSAAILAAVRSSKK